MGIEKSEKQSWSVALIGSALVTAIMAATVATTRSKGEPVGFIDLLAASADASAAMHLSADMAGSSSSGEKLYFRLHELVVERDTSGANAQTATERQLLSHLRGSSITIDVIGKDSVAQSVKCPVYSGISANSGLTRDSFALSGVKLGCEVPVPAASGPYKVVPRVDWSSDLSVRVARLEVRKGD